MIIIGPTLIILVMLIIIFWPVIKISFQIAKRVMFASLKVLMIGVGILLLVSWIVIL